MLNKVILMGRLTRDAEIRYAQGSDTAVAKFSLAVERKYSKQGEEKVTDFINCVAFGSTAEFIGKYFAKGNMLAVTGSIQTGSYTNREGQKVYTTEVAVSEADFTGEKTERQPTPQAPPQPAPKDLGDGFMNIPDGIDEELPFN